MAYAWPSEEETEDLHVVDDAQRGSSAKSLTDTSPTGAQWLSRLSTAMGLGGLVSQAYLTMDSLNTGTQNIWESGLLEAFCSHNVLHFTRLPLSSLEDPGKASWVCLLAILHHEKPVLEKRLGSSSTLQSGPSANEKPRLSLGRRSVDESWHELVRLMVPLKQYQNSICITITRAAFITLLCITNARKVFQHSDSSGLRAAYPSYGGQWHLNWPVGQEAMVKLVPHDSHHIVTDLYPLSFVQRVEGCILMQCGIVQSRKEKVKIAFCGRKPPADYLLKFIKRGFGGTHGSRYLYSIMGGDVTEVDFMSAMAVPEGMKEDLLTLQLPSTVGGWHVNMKVPAESQEKIKLALDCLPWSSLSFSLHRGMRDILLAFGKPVMDSYREELAALVKKTIVENPQALGRGTGGLGWEDKHVRLSMSDMAAGAILACGGNSGDLVRTVTDAVRAHLSHTDLAQHLEELDEVDFWRLADEARELDEAGVIALTKFFVLEWSIEMDYQLYHQLPLTLNFG